VVRVLHVLESQNLLVAQATGFDPVQEANDRFIGLLAVWNQQVGVFGRSQKPVGDHGETANHDVLESYGVGVGDDAVEVRTRRLVSGHGRRVSTKPAAVQPAERVSDPVLCARRE